MINKLKELVRIIELIFADSKSHTTTGIEQVLEWLINIFRGKALTLVNKDKINIDELDK